MDSLPIILTTDFGTADVYVGIMKGVILTINPKATIVDLTHQIQPQNIRQAAFILRASLRFFPPQAIHVVVVDPGVGTDRRALLVVTPTARFLAPDNGVLSHVIPSLMALPNQGEARGEPTPSGVSLRAPVPPGCSAYQLTNPQYWLQPISDTFQGRDIFAPVAAHLSLGVPPASLGSPMNDLLWLATPEPDHQGNAVQGEVIYIDRFGNLVTNLSLQQLARAGIESAPAQILVEIKGRRIGKLSRTFHEEDGEVTGRLLALISSYGYLEIAVRDGSAAVELGVSIGEPVYVRATSLT
jgi:S-adenosylmethionine hydrolase